MGFYGEQIVPRLTHFTLRVGPIAKLRAEHLSQAYGTVLDVGFGSGLNLPHYTDAVTKVLAIEPSEVARRMAQPLVASAKFPVEFAGLDGQRLAVDSESMDCIVTTWTLCTIPEPKMALTEFARVLKPGGKFLFVEHGLAPDENVARWQNRLDRVQMVLAGGCHLNRHIEKLISDSPLQIRSLKKSYFTGPRTHAYFYTGVATKFNVR
jgi:ubiquinone/menaquinone biosynthesis C-methylase UbiE